MIVTTRGSVFRLLKWQRRNAVVFALLATAVVLVHQGGASWFVLPQLPLAVVGGAIGIFVSFRTNSAYDRWWEGRKLWGKLINASRMWCTQVLTYLPQGETGSLRTRLVQRHIAYVHVLRCLLREQDPWADEEVRHHLDDTPARKAESNLTHALLHEQMQDLCALSERGLVDPMRLMSMDRTIAVLLDVQGGCERIKKTPMPRGYGFIAERLIVAYALMFPMAVVASLGWWTIPISVLVCLAFALISEAGRVLEDPFTMYWNGLPLCALCRTIEVNLRQRLGETDLPPMLTASPEGILM